MGNRKPAEIIVRDTTAYMFHPMIIVPVTLFFSPLALYPIAEWLMLCAIGVPLCLATTHLVFRRIPLLKKVL
jgi:hypothetical protein